MIFLIQDKMSPVHTSAEVVNFDESNVLEQLATVDKSQKDVALVMTDEQLVGNMPLFQRMRQVPNIIDPVDVKSATSKWMLAPTLLPRLLSDKLPAPVNPNSKATEPVEGDVKPVDQVMREFEKKMAKSPSFNKGLPIIDTSPTSSVRSQQQTAAEDQSNDLKEIDDADADS